MDLSRVQRTVSEAEVAATLRIMDSLNTAALVLLARMMSVPGVISSPTELTFCGNGHALFEDIEQVLTTAGYAPCECCGDWTKRPHRCRP